MTMPLALPPRFFSPLIAIQSSANENEHAEHRRSRYVLPNLDPKTAWSDLRLEYWPAAFAARS
jgi:hypothetical protein